MKTGFNVLDKELDIHRNYFLEASAGTGKTFSIENIVVRLLLSDKPLLLDEILVVTFTKAATRDLKVRIRGCIKSILSCLKSKKSSLDYVKAIIDKGDAAIQTAERRLKQALLAYDQAHIYTIHQFCFRMLNDFVFEGNCFLDNASEDCPLSHSYILTIIRDYFRTEVHAGSYSPQQIRRILEAFKTMEKLEEEILRAITKGVEIVDVPSYEEQFLEFQRAMHTLRYEKGITGEKIISDFIKLVPSYNGICDTSKNIKKEHMEKVEKFASLFDLDSWDKSSFEILIEDNLSLVDLLDPKKLKKNVLPTPTMAEWIKSSFEKLVSSQIVFARMANGCRKLLKRHLAEEEILGFEELLEATRTASMNPQFVQAVRGKFRSAIIDEFQDTDNIQWDIFRNLFMNSSDGWGTLYLVGDPKQSIYAFRQADIYTYIEAGNALGKGSQATLDTNFRSQPSLIHALNALFKACPQLISLPKINDCLEYKSVNAPLSAKEKHFSDNLGSINFCVVKNDETIFQSEEKHYFPYIAQEIQRLNRQDGVSYNQFAILVSDRFQSKRAAEFLDGWNIPAITQRSNLITETDAYQALRSVLKGVISPNHESALRNALGSPLMGWTHEEVRMLDQLEFLQDVLERFYIMRRKLFEEGFSSFFQHLMNHSWKAGLKTVREELLMREGGGEFYQDLQSILEIILDEQCKHTLNPIGILKFLDDFKSVLESEDERVKRSLDLTQDAVNILTVHYSKGLEFQVVFTLGLINSLSKDEWLIPADKVLEPVSDLNDPNYIRYKKEMDAEKMRQLYVAMTRAKYRLYCPVKLYAKENKMKFGEASPMEIFLAKCNREQAGEEILYERIASENGSELKKFIDESASSISYTDLNESHFDMEKTASKAAPELISPESFAPVGDPVYIHSFTSLSRHENGPAEFIGAPRDFSAVEKNPHTLPSGSETGNLLHLILENYRFGSSVEDSVRPYVEHSAYKEWFQVICDIISNVIHMPLPDGFSLNDIDPDKVFKETEFLYPYQSHFLKGIIDLVFEHRGKYYIVDWKSNWLGSDNSYYSEERLKKAMHDNNYFFQADLYKDALQKYLRIVQDEDFDAVFGGSYYLFLRGQGVYKC